MIDLKWDDLKKHVDKGDLIHWLDRQKECHTCNLDPSMCGCDEEDEDENGSCTFWRMK